MPQLGNPAVLQSQIKERSNQYFDELKHANLMKTDLLFGGLLTFEWFAGIIVALTISPRTWAGSHSDVHIHVWTAIILGALIVAQPINLAITRPGQTLTRHVIAIGQMLWSALLIHLMGGRIEAHFDIFGSLAFLSFYRDWRVLISASIVVVLDHFLRGLYFPFSIYGVNIVQNWRWVEHAWWVVFEDLFLIRSCLANTAEMQAIALRQAALEETRNNVELLVNDRTRELLASERRLAGQYEITRTLAEAHTLAQAMPKILESVAAVIVPSEFSCLTIYSGVQADSNGNDGSSDRTLRTSGGGVESNHEKMGTISSDSTPYPQPSLQSSTRTLTAPIVYQRWTPLEGGSNDQVNAAAADSSNISGDQGLTDPGRPGLNHIHSFFITTERKQHGMIQVYSDQPVRPSEAELAMLESLGRQVGEFIELRAAEQDIRHLADLVQSCADAIVGLDLSGIITSWNRGAEKLFGFSADEMRGQHISLLVPLRKVDEIENFLNGDSPDQSEDLEFITSAKNGQEIAVSLSASLVQDDNGMLVGRSAIMHDITAKQEAARRVAEFYSVVSHELRTPLTSIRGVLGLMEGGIVEPGSIEAQELLEVAAGSTDRLIRLINDMLDIKKIEAGKMNLHIESFECSRLVLEALEAIKGFSEQQKVTLRTELNYHGTILADRDKTLQILTNLVSNAIKFSPENSEVIVRTEFHSGMVHIAVRDYGPGIADGDRLKLFGKFQQLDSSDSRQRGGTGLGLAISKALVERQNGTIGVDSALGQGSCFWFELPTKQEHPKSSMSGNNGSSKKILLVENDDNLAVMLSQLLHKAGHSVTQAASLKDARLALAEAGPPPQVILLDLALDDGNGLDLLEDIRSKEQLKDTPVIVITAQSVEDNVQGRAMVFDWLVKPFNINLLMEAIKRASGERGQRVLVVNEDAKERVYLIEQLHNMGVKCLEADQCKTAVDIAMNEKPDIIILDINKANFKTIKELSALHKDTRTNIPLVLYTSHHLSQKEKLEISETVSGPLGNIREEEDLLSAVESIINS